MKNDFRWEKCINIIMKTFKRQVRRHHEFRIFKKSLKIQCLNGRHLDKDIDIISKKLQNNLKNCSCLLCCNVRRSPWLSNRGKLSIQERKFFDQQLIIE